MAMVACRECSREVATSARTCPQCGVARPATSPGKGEFARDALVALLAVVAVVAIIVVLSTG